MKQMQNDPRNDPRIIRIHRFEGDTKTKAFVDIGVGDFIVKGLRVVEGQNGLFIAMPREKGKDGKWYNSFFPATRAARDNLSSIVLAAYEQ